LKKRETGAARYDPRMIQKLSHATVYVIDQDRAKDFYVGKLGFEVRTDATMGPFRWLTVGPKGQPDMEIILMRISAGEMLDEASAAQLRALVEKGVFVCGALETADVRKDYEELSRKGVRFRGPPAERPYGIECVLQDDSGNWFSLCQRPASR
jgi:catechol 2,3-dioxygenase-like lactoylglutathione lyase family enzyme